jgi:hypothetical protein
MSAKSYLDERKKEALVEKAIEYRERYGMSVFPVGNPKAELPNKVPNFPWGNLTKGRLPTKMLQEQMGKWSVTGVGVVMGKSSGNLACRDFDTEESYAEWSSKSHRIAATTPTVKTRRGYHVYFRTPQRRSYRDCVVFRHKSQEGEYRGNNCICVLPPSLHPEGMEYNWLHSPEDLGGFPTLEPVEEGLLPDPIQDDSTPLPSPDNIKGLLLQYQNEATTAPLHPLHCGEEEERRELLNSVSPPSGDRSVISRSALLPALNSLDHVLVRHRPPSFGNRNRCLLDLYIDLRLRLPAVPAADLEPAVYRWFEMSRGVIRTQQWTVTLGEFRDMCKWRPNPLPPAALAVRPLRQHTSGAVWMPAADERYRSLPSLEKLKLLCQHLSKLTQNGDFFLSGRRAAAETGVAHKTAARDLIRLIKAGWLAVVKPGSRGISTEDRPRNATVYRVVGVSRASPAC